MSISFHVSAQQVTSNSHADYKHPQLTSQFKGSKEIGSSEFYAGDNQSYKDQRLKKSILRKRNKDVSIIPDKKRKNVSYKHPYAL